MNRYILLCLLLTLNVFAEPDVITHQKLDEANAILGEIKTKADEITSINSGLSGISDYLIQPASTSDPYTSLIDTKKFMLDFSSNADSYDSRVINTVNNLVTRATWGDSKYDDYYPLGKSVQKVGDSNNVTMKGDKSYWNSSVRNLVFTCDQESLTAKDLFSCGKQGSSADYVNANTNIAKILNNNSFVYNPGTISSDEDLMAYNQYKYALEYIKLIDADHIKNIALVKDIIRENQGNGVSPAEANEKVTNAFRGIAARSATSAALASILERRTSESLSKPSMMKSLNDFVNSKTSSEYNEQLKDMKSNELAREQTAMLAGLMQTMLLLHKDLESITSILAVNSFAGKEQKEIEVNMDKLQNNSPFQ
jgi:hypothetical protein